MESINVEDVLVPVDFSEPSERALAFAASLVRRGEIHLLHVVDASFIKRAEHEGLADSESLTQRLTERAERKLEELAARFSRDGLVVTPVVVVGAPFVQILRLARELDFQMLVIGTYGRRSIGAERILFGSTAEHVLRAATLPVLCVPLEVSIET